MTISGRCGIHLIISFLIDTYGNVDLLDPDQEAAIAEFEFLAHEAEDDDQKEMSHRYDGSEEEYAQGMETSMPVLVTSCHKHKFLIDCSG
jgi:hypothetical protein